MTTKLTVPTATPIDLENEVIYGIGAVVSKTLLKKDTGNLTLFAFDTGQGLSEHTAPFDAVVTIVDGAAEVIIGGETHSVRKGEMIVMPAGIPHALNAPEPFKMLLVMIRGE
jgi:quercetin dioxygenase-like cupin family protein